MATQGSLDVACCGRLVFDPEHKETKASAPFVTALISLEVPFGYENVKIVAFGDEADALANLGKGDLIAVEGHGRIERWTGPDGVSHVQLAIIPRCLRHIGQIGRRSPPDTLPLRNTIPRNTTAELRERFGD